MVGEFKPKISIIVAIYQVEKYLERCLDSIVSQSYENLQIILVDDGSNDGSPKICDRYSVLDDRVEVYHKENGGLVSARKYGIGKASGDYIAFVDGDDFLDKDMYAELIDEIVKSGADFLNSGYKMIYPDSTYESVNATTFVYEVRSEGDRIDLVESCFFGRKRDKYVNPSIWSKLFRADFIKESYSLVPDNQDYGEDLICLYCCMVKCNKVISVDKTFYNYNVREGSMSNIHRERYFRNELRLYDVMFEVNEKLSKPVDDSRFYIWIREKVKNLMMLTAETDDVLRMVQYYIKDYTDIIGKRIVIYGAGTVGKSYYTQLVENGKCDVVGMIDKNYKEIVHPNTNIYGISELERLEYDAIVIGLLDKKDAGDVKNELIELGIDSEKIFWYEPCI